MDWVVWLLFESAAALGTVLGLTLFGLLVFWRQRGRLRPLLVGLGASIVLLIVQALVATQRERAGWALDAIERDLIHSRSDALAASLSPDFDAGRYAGGALDRGAFLDFVRGMQERVAIRWIQRTELVRTTGTDDEFTVSAAYMADIVIDRFSGTFRSRWAIAFARGPDGWRIRRIQAEHVDGVPNPTWDNLERQ